MSLPWLSAQYPRNDIPYSSGDYTLAATDMAIRDIVKEDADEHFVVVVSDANLRRYGISPRTVLPME